MYCRQWTLFFPLGLRVFILFFDLLTFINVDVFFYLLVFSKRGSVCELFYFLLDQQGTADPLQLLSDLFHADFCCIVLRFSQFYG